MATAPYFAGREGELGVSAASSITTVVFGKLTNFRMFANQAVIPVTNFDSSGWEENIGGTRSWGCTAETLMISTAGTVEHDTLRDYLSSATRGWYKIANTSTTPTAGYYWEGFGYVEDWDASGEEAGPQIQNFSIKGDGKYAEVST